MTDSILTLTETAEWLKRPPATLRFWRATGVGPPSARVQGRVMYRRADVEQWLNGEFEADANHGAVAS